MTQPLIIFFLVDYNHCTVHRSSYYTSIMMTYPLIILFLGGYNHSITPTVMTQPLIIFYSERL